MTTYKVSDFQTTVAVNVTEQIRIALRSLPDGDLLTPAELVAKVGHPGEEFLLESLSRRDKSVFRMVVADPKNTPDQHQVPYIVLWGNPRSIQTLRAKVQDNTKNMISKFSV